MTKHAPYASSPGTCGGPGIYEPVTADNALNACWGHLLTTIGLASLYRERASQVNAMPAPVGRPWRSIT